MNHFATRAAARPNSLLVGYLVLRVRLNDWLIGRLEALIRVINHSAELIDYQSDRLEINLGQ